MGFSCGTGESVTEAKKALKKDSFDWVLLDLHLGGENDNALLW